MKKFLVIGLLTFALGTVSKADQAPDDSTFETGNSYLGMTPYGQDAYVIGLADMVTYFEIERRTGNVVCIPHQVVAGQLRLVFNKYLQDHPSHLHMPASELFIFAMNMYYPCEK